MTYERDRLNRACAENEVVIKKSSLMAMTIGLIATVAIICGLAWQNYQQQEQINNLTNNNPQLRTTTVTQQSTQPSPQQ